MPDRTHAVAASLSEELTRQFYGWECRGRGWLLWDEAVALEPPFIPFRYHLPTSRQQEDDGRRHTFLSGLVAAVISSLSGTGSDVAVHKPGDSGLGWPTLEINEQEIVEYDLLLPPDQTVPKQVLLQLLLGLSSIDSPVAFEVIGEGGQIRYRFSCRSAAAPLLLAQARALLHEAVLQATDRSLSDFWPAGTDTLVVEFGLSEEFFRPLQTFRNFDVDPLHGVLAILDGLAAGEAALYQVLFQPCAAPWAASVMNGVTDGEGGSFFVDAPELLSMAREKLAFPLYAVVVRIGVATATRVRSMEVARALAGALTPLSLPASNELIPLSNEQYDEAAHRVNLLSRSTFRSGMILNAEELLGLVHPPSATVHCPGLLRTSGQTKAAPSDAARGELNLGNNLHHGVERPVSLTVDQRTRHMHVIGASGTGKSTLLLNLIRQDLEQGNGFAVLDPHGDLIDDILLLVPEHRVNDIIVFDPADAEYPVGFNMLSAHSEAERSLIASDFVAIFQRLATSWGDQMTTVFSNAVLAFLDSERGGTLSDLRRFLVEKDFRSDFLQTVPDPHLVYYWQREFPLLSGRPQSPILTRLDAFLRSKLVRNIVSQPENKLDFTHIMDSGKVFLARLSQGAIGEENAYLLGSLLVSKLHQTALARQGQERERRQPYFLYMDEFQNFITPSMAAILSGVRKYGLGLILAHQELRQLERRDSEVAYSVLSNPHTRVCFRVGEQDAKRLAEGFHAFKPGDLLNLGTGEALARFEQARHDFNLQTYPAPEPGPRARERRDQIIALSRSRYASSREAVEQALSLPSRLPAEQVPLRRAAARPKAISPEAPTLNEVSVFPVAPLPAIREKPALQPLKPASLSGLMGKGGQEHRYLQQLVKRWAEGMGYKASIEHQLENGGSVDLLLAKEGYTVACEVTVSTTPEHELQNVCKCLASGFQQVFLVGLDTRKVARVRELVAQNLPEEEARRVAGGEPARLFEFLQEREAQTASTSKVVRGYRVNINYQPTTEGEQQARRGSVTKVVAQALKRRSGDGGSSS